MSVRANAWNAVMTAEPGEQELEIPASMIEGTVPPELAGGRHLQNGPGWTKIGGRLEHPRRATLSHPEPLTVGAASAAIGG